MTPKDADGTHTHHISDCKEPLQHPFPDRPNGDPWKVVLEKLLAEDKIQCEAWKDEVQILLLFAGLFSAVVTAFSVESYKSVRSDLDDTTVMLLARIASSLENPGGNSTIQPTILDPPTASAIRINVLWFLSLVLALTTVLIGITLLQWIREHQRYTSADPRISVGIFHMRAEGMKRWRVRHIFTALPLLLQSALILFFVGAIDFLISLSLTIAIPVIVVIGFALCFFMITTALPTLQVIVFNPSVPSNDHAPPVQCPFKSPQSLAFRRLATLSKAAFMFAYRRGTFVSHGLTRFFTFKEGRKWLRNEHIAHGSFDLYHTWAMKDWFDFDKRWLSHRGEHVAATHGAHLGHPSSDELYDSFLSAQKVLKKYSTDAETLTAAYCCLEGMLLTASSRPNQVNDFALFLPRGKDFQDTEYLTTYAVDHLPQVKRLEVLERCLLPLHSRSDILAVLGEGKMRVLNYFLGNKPIKLRLENAPSDGILNNYYATTNNKFWESYIVYFDRYLRTSKNARYEFWTIVDSLFKVAASSRDRDVLQTFHVSTAAKDVIDMAAVHFYRMDYQPGPSIFPLLNTLKSGLSDNLARSLLNDLNGESDEKEEVKVKEDRRKGYNAPPAYIFVCSTLFMQSLTDFDLFEAHLLLRYEECLDKNWLEANYWHILHPDDYPSGAKFTNRFPRSMLGSSSKEE